MKFSFLPLLSLLILSCNASKTTSKAWNQQTQSIPGKIECEWYDLGGEGVAYHDTDSINNGSGKLNPVNGNPLHEFRIKEGVDISYTKSGGIDDTPYNQSVRNMNQLYVGWTEPDEWINYSLRVKETGNYRISLMYTANGDGSIAFDLDGKRVTKSLKVPSTNNPKDTVAWRQWHHWNKTDLSGEIRLSKGQHKLRLHVVEHGNMNFDWLGFVKVD